MSTAPPTKDNFERALPALKSLAGFLAMLIFLFVTVRNAVKPESYLVSNFGARPETAQAYIACLFFSAVHGVRLWMGLNFLDSDKSFVAAKKHMASVDPKTGRMTEKRHVILLILLLLTSLLYTLFLAGRIFGTYGLCLVYILQSAILIEFDRLYWTILITKDKESAANKFIIVGDAVVVAMSISMTVFSTSDVFGWTDRDNEASIVFFTLSGGITVVFIGEVWSQYGPALVDQARSLRDVVLE